MTDVLHDVLGNLLFDARHIAVVSDADGCLLWSDGHPSVLRASEQIGFTPGHRWSERAAGTNAIGTALAADYAVQVFSAEHYRAEIHGWQCSGAPIHDPETGELLGAIDVSGRWDTASPHTLTLVQMAARLVQERLRAQMLNATRGSSACSPSTRPATRHIHPCPRPPSAPQDGCWPPPAAGARWCAGAGSTSGPSAVT
jgi:transcriptional regulator of acetoin/glycerol metabolism